MSGQVVDGTENSLPTQGLDQIDPVFFYVDTSEQVQDQLRYGNQVYENYGYVTRRHKDHYNEIPSTYYISVPAFSCRKCLQSFTSNNKLYYHVRTQACHAPQIATSLAPSSLVEPLVIKSTTPPKLQAMKPITHRAALGSPNCVGQESHTVTGDGLPVRS
jgi:hypothetical protein